MAYLVETITDPVKIRELNTCVTGTVTPMFTEAIATETVKVEWWGSSFSDPGDDWNEFKAIDANGVVLASYRESGY